MSWYYAEAGQQKGPVSESELDGLYSAGTIKPDTLVWKEGMADWQPYRVARATLATGAQVTGPAGGSSAPAPAGGIVCSQCGQTFSPGEVIRYGDVWVCANCKPTFLQKVREGSSAAGAGVLHYAGFWIRFVAYFVDQLILGLLGGVIGVLVGLGMSSNTPDAQIIAQVISGAVGLILGAAYTTWFLGKFGATPGKMACKLRVVTPEGGPITYGRAFGRYLASIVSGLICAIGYIMAAFDDEKRALHDRICNTRVVKQL
jgi:uncharacterized RDD family membrane protein YckC